MFELKTKRLRLIPLRLEELKLLQSDWRKLEKKLKIDLKDCMHDPVIAPEVTQSCSIWIEDVERDPDNWLWHTNWEIVLRRGGKSIGGFCFYGSPDSRGEVQIGYLIRKEYQNKGYMTETLRKIVAWAFLQPNVDSIKAETPKNNIPSQRVLEKIGMRQRGETGETIWWRRLKEEN